MATQEEKHNSSWVVDVDKMFADDNPQSRRMEAERWEAQSIYLVPEWLKGTNTKAYQPQLVSLGPFHHRDSNLLPMEEHKHRALLHLIKRSKKPLQDFISVINDVAKELEAAYGKDLDDKWRKDRRGFTDMMLTDGCFLLEMMSGPFRGYELHDPVFSRHGRQRLYPVILSDMLLIENQLPLLVLKKILGVMRPNYPQQVQTDIDINLTVRECLRRAHEGRDIVEVFESLKEVAVDRYINIIVLNFLGRADEGLDMANMSLRLHPLELYHGSLTYSCDAHGEYKKLQEYECKYEMVPSALEIHEAGIKFRPSKSDKLLDIRFDSGILSMRGVLTMLVMRVDDSTESLYLNLMAFERLHAGAGDLVTAYVIFVDNIIVSAKDVAMLSSNGVLENMVGCDEEVVKLFNGTLSRGQVLGPCPGLEKVQSQVKTYCGESWHKWRATLIRTYFRNPWAFISLAAAALLLIATLLQTAYTVMLNKP